MGRPPCCDKVGVKKGPWTPEEDIMLVSYLQEHGPGNWRAVPTNTGLRRCSKSCRLRWTNYLRPGIKRGSFTDQEEKLIIQLQALLGNKWAAIASYLPERTDNDIKNYWNTHLKKKLKKAESASDYLKPTDILSTSHSVSKGKWERRLQADINTAKQALHDALSLDKTNLEFESLIPDTKPSFGSNSFTKPGKVPTYASSTENIARLLQGWTKNPKSKRNGHDSASFSTQHSFNTTTNTGANNVDSSGSSNESGIDLSEAFDNLFGFESFDSASSVFSASTSTTSPEASLFQGESRMEEETHVPLSLLENWLLLEDGGTPAKEDLLTSFLFDEYHSILF